MNTYFILIIPYNLINIIHFVGIWFDFKLNSITYIFYLKLNLERIMEDDPF